MFFSLTSQFDHSLDLTVTDAGQELKFPVGRKRWLAIILMAVAVPGVVGGLVFLGPGIPGVVKTVNAQRMPIQQTTQFNGRNYAGYVTVHAAYYLPDASTFILQLSSQFPGTIITALSVSLDAKPPLTSCVGGSATGGGIGEWALPAGCYPKNALIGTGKVWLMTPLNPCGDFVVSGFVGIWTSTLQNSTRYIDPNDGTANASGVQFQCVFPHATEYVFLSPFIELNFGSLPDYEALAKGSDSLRATSSTSVEFPVTNTGTLPVTLTQYSVLKNVVNGPQYASGPLTGPSISPQATANVNLTTDGSVTYEAGFCYSVTFVTSRIVRFPFIFCVVP